MNNLAMSPERSNLFSPVCLGEISLSNRIVMAPMTRSRADENGAPADLHVDYYRQRATAGLIVTEGTYPCLDGKGYYRTPGIVTPQQMAGWRRVTDAVHAQGGRIVMQLMHVGRAASDHNKSGARTLAPSAIRAEAQIYTDAVGLVDTDTPEAMTAAEIVATIDAYRQAALNARAAGFDGVELHASSGYLPMQFLLECSNRRDDGYGGGLHARVRFTVEVLEHMSQAIGAARVGLRLCPGNPYNDMHDPAPESTYGALLSAIRGLGLAYVHVSRSPQPALDAFALVRRHFDGPVIVNDGFDGNSARTAIADGIGQAVSFGRHFIANPDLVARLQHDTALARFDRHTLYTAGPQGYSDYPSAN